MRRTLWMTVTLALVAGWLLVSYLPGALAAMPSIGYPGWATSLLTGLALAAAAAFVAIQVWIVRTTDRSLVAAGDTAREFNLRRGPEAFWTALPVLMTVLLVAAVWLIRQAGA
jgi:uncharacterized membrane protein YhdT